MWRGTERYVKMCIKAEEIQKEWKPQSGDWFVDFCGDIKVGIGFYNHPLRLQRLKAGTKRFWLPTQEQLWERLGDKGLNKEDREKMIEDFFNFAIDNRYCGEGTYKLPLLAPVDIFTSIQEIVFAFVMWKKYQKVWDDEKEEWVKGGEL